MCTTLSGSVVNCSDYAGGSGGKGGGGKGGGSGGKGKGLGPSTGAGECPQNIGRVAWRTIHRFLEREP